MEKRILSGNNGITNWHVFCYRKEVGVLKNAINTINRLATADRRGFKESQTEEGPVFLRRDWKQRTLRGFQPEKGGSDQTISEKQRLA